MGIGKFSAIVLAVLVLLASGIYASGFENSGIGMKARGMSGAYRAIADDWTAAYYNPAGYAWILDDQFGSAFAFVHHRDEIVPDVRWGGVYDRGIFNDRVNYNNHQILSNPSAGLIFRLPGTGDSVVASPDGSSGLSGSSMVFGLSAYQRFDQNITWRLFQPSPSYNDSIAIPGDQFSTNLDVVTFQLTAAKVLVPEKLSAGIGLQLMRADLVYSNVYFRTNPITNSPSDPLYDDMQDYPYDRVSQWNKNNGTGWGFGLTAGVLLKVNEKMRAGFSANLPFSMTVSGEAQSEYYMPNNPDLASSGGYTPGTVQGLFISGGVVKPNYDFEASLDLPPSFGLGVSYQATERLLVALDAEYTMWSAYEGLEFEYSEATNLFGPADTSAMARDFFSSNVSAAADWDNAAKLMLGAAYEIPQFLTPDLGLTVVGGVSADQSPARNSKQLTPQFIDTRNKFGLSLGGIVHIQRWDLGFVTSYTKQQQGDINRFAMDDEFVSFPGDYKAETYETILSFNYRF